MQKRVEKAFTAMTDRAEVAANKAEVDLEAKMKSDAPWTDDTGAARQGLFAVSERKRDVISIHLGHRVSYGVYLETLNAERYAVVWPTIRGEAETVKRSIAEAMRRG